MHILDNSDKPKEKKALVFSDPNFTFTIPVRSDATIGGWVERTTTTTCYWGAGDSPTTDRR